MQPWLYLIVVACAIGVSVDASRLDARRGALGGGLPDMGPAAWFFACLLVWNVTLPCYLATRPKLVRRARAMAMHPQFAAPGCAQVGPAPMPPGEYAFAPPLPQAVPYPAFAPPSSVASPVGPPPGYYPNPNGPGTRWWDGANWEGNDT